MITNSLQAELFSLRRRPGVWVLSGVWAFQIVFFAYIVFAIVYATQRDTVPADEADTMLSQLLPAGVDHRCWLRCRCTAAP
ncbi:hypothetical protein [Phytoactinopolyspora endophytica]|uniref:hypothetical protein n=1 Tax=Phytoactinopolyspora endophytica TaxID=1642495 RepID=UPI00101D2A98|nr:hypothetical protein [Phytoactinopolyspora endophytica]